VAKRILAVDDNHVMLDVYSHLLTEEGYEVTIAKDGVQALKALEVEDPDLVLLDIEMPNISGWQVLEIMRSRVEWHEIPVIMVTALIEPSATEEESHPEYDCYVTKKATGGELLTLVAEALEGAVATPAESPADNSQPVCPSAVQEESRSASEQQDS